MKPFLDISNFGRYFNTENIVITPTTTSAVIHGKDYSASLLMRAEQDYKENFTIEFNLAFEHKKHSGEGTVFRREFRIEHHPEDKSRHSGPHVQIHIHGPAAPNLVGQMWIGLPVKNEGEYVKCIEGFFCLLEGIIKSCRQGLEKDMLNLDEVMRLSEQRVFLLGMIKSSLHSNAIELKNPEGKKVILYPHNVSRILDKDETLLPFFEEREK